MITTKITKGILKAKGKQICCQTSNTATGSPLLFELHLPGFHAFAYHPQTGDYLPKVRADDLNKLNVLNYHFADLGRNLVHTRRRNFHTVRLQRPICIKSIIESTSQVSQALLHLSFLAPKDRFFCSLSSLFEGRCYRPPKVDSQAKNFNHAFMIFITTLRNLVRTSPAGKAPKTAYSLSGTFEDVQTQPNILRTSLQAFRETARSL
jgi:hypothetical protein